MPYKILILLSLFGFSCGSIHPITEVTHTNLQFGVDGVRLNNFPHTVVDSLGWNDLSSAKLNSVDEEFQIAIKSDSPPFYLFKISNDLKDTLEVILYWPKPNFPIALDPIKNMHDYLIGTCNEFKNADIYEYCIPQSSNIKNYEKVFSNLVNANIWTLSDDLEFDKFQKEISTNWSIIYQIRAGMNHRTFQHNNPTNYVYNANTFNVLKIVTQLKLIAINLTPADNYNSFQGIISGVNKTTFKPCNNNEIWRFNGNIEELISKNGLPFKIVNADSVRFMVKLEGTVRDEWVADINSTGFTKIISPVNINSIAITSATECD